MTTPLTPPNFERFDTVTMSSGTMILVLPAPALGDTERISATRIQTETRGGDSIIFRDSSWPQDDELSLTFTNLKESQKDGLLLFLSRTLGRSFTYTDHLGQQWSAIVTTPDSQVTQESESGPCSRYTVDLTLNVVLTSWP